MNRKFKKGDRVVIRKSSEYYNTCASNPAGVTGTVQRVGKISEHLNINVKWDDTGVNNSYNACDLQLVQEEKPVALTVDKEFVMQAYESACSTWKEKIEKKFPELFDNKYSKLIEDGDLPYTSYLFYKNRNNEYVQLKHGLSLIDGVADGRYLPKETKYRGLYIHDPEHAIELEIVKTGTGQSIVFKKKNS